MESMGSLMSLSLLIMTAAWMGCSPGCPRRTSHSKWAATLMSKPFSSRRATDTIKCALGSSWSALFLILTGQLGVVRWVGHGG